MKNNAIVTNIALALKEKAPLPNPHSWLHSKVAFKSPELSLEHFKVQSANTLIAGGAPAYEL